MRSLVGAVTGVARATLVGRRRMGERAAARATLPASFFLLQSSGSFQILCSECMSAQLFSQRLPHMRAVTPHRHTVAWSRVLAGAARLWWGYSRQTHDSAGGANVIA